MSKRAGMISLSDIPIYDELWECTHDPETMRRIAMLCPPRDMPDGPIIIESTPVPESLSKMYRELAADGVWPYTEWVKNAN